MALTKILKNNTVSDITVRGVVIRVAGSYTVRTDRFAVWADDADVDALITSGDIIVNDGTADLDAANGLRQIKKISTAEQVDVDLTPFQNIASDDDVQAVLPELIPTVEQDDGTVTQQATNFDFKGNVSVVDEGNGEATVTVGTASALGGIYSIFWSEGGSAKDEYIDTSGRRYSNQVPHIIPFKSKIIAYTFSNRDNDGDTDVQLWRVPEGSGNSPRTKLDEWVLRNVRTARKTNFATDLIFEAGDKVVCYLKDRGTDPDDVVFTVYLQIIEQDSTEVIETWSGNIDPISSGDDDDDDDD